MHFLSTVVSAMLISACTLTGAAPSDKGEAIRIIAAKEELKQMCLQILGSSPAFMAFDGKCLAPNLLRIPIADTKYYAISFGYKNKCLALASETTTSLADCNLNDSNQHWHFSDGPKDDKYPDNKVKLRPYNQSKGFSHGSCAFRTNDRSRNFPLDIENCNRNSEAQYFLVKH